MKSTALIASMTLGLIASGTAMILIPTTNIDYGVICGNKIHDGDRLRHAYGGSRSKVCI